MNLEWKYKRIYWKVRKYLDVHLKIRFSRNRYNGQQILSIADTNNQLEQLIVSGKPFAVGRIGGTELKAMVACQKEFHDLKEKESCRSLLICLSGFYGDMKEFERFGKLMEISLKEIDLVGVWYNQMEDYMLKHYAANTTKYGKLEGLEPWYCKEKPWSRALKGKKVVCIHPFAESIMAQYEKREQLFPGLEILPEFELRCVKAVQTLFGQEDKRFASWFDALDYMVEEAMKEEFDVALIACGAYGLPLAARLKQKGKQAIHVGGALQLLFGIRGSRWDDFEELNTVYNDAWQYPLACDQLTTGNDNVENGCYW
ncbi:MAG TPA: hypothetical protein PLZ77_00025 [Lachnospiraceae bacterium]|nr:hypothetical protein [Lachnospiraceae bacterium]